MPKMIADATVDELRDEIRRREDAALTNMPSMLVNQDFGRLREVVREGLHDAWTSGHLDEDFKQYVYEEALRALYGEQVFAAMRRRFR